METRCSVISKFPMTLMNFISSNNEVLCCILIEKLFLSFSRLGRRVVIQYLIDRKYSSKHKVFLVKPRLKSHMHELVAEFYLALGKWPEMKSRILTIRHQDRKNTYILSEIIKNIVSENLHYRTYEQQ